MRDHLRIPGAERFLAIGFLSFLPFWRICTNIFFDSLPVLIRPCWLLPSIRSGVSQIKKNVFSFPRRSLVYHCAPTVSGLHIAVCADHFIASKAVHLNVDQTDKASVPG